MARKRRRAPVSSDKRFKKYAADSGPMERWQHSGRVLEHTEIAGVFVARATESHALDHLLQARSISPEEHEAGMRFHSDFVLARIEDRVAVSFSSARGSKGDPHGKLERNHAQEAAYYRWRRALAAVHPVLQDSLIHVACIANAPSPAQLLRCRLALEKLVKFYGI